MEEGGEHFDRSLVSSQRGDKEVIRCWRGVSLIGFTSFSFLLLLLSFVRFYLCLLREYAR